MNKKEFDKKYVGEKLVVNCKTKESAKEFLAMADKFGYRWWHGGKFDGYISWDIHRKDTCYSLFRGTSSPKWFFLESGYKTIEFNGFSKHEEYKLIVSENKKTVVLIDKLGNKGKAKCCDSDKFDLGFGVKLAKARLEGDKEEVERLIKSSNKTKSLLIDLKVELDKDKLVKDINEAVMDNIKFKF